jgi:acetyl esterase/lipase
MKIRTVLLMATVLLAGLRAHSQESIPLYEGPAPGTEEWHHVEKEYFSKIFNTDVVTNVTQPTIAAFLPKPEDATGAAVIIAPGGGFYALSINSEGNDVAKWLTKHGVAGFVLRYRLVQTGSDGVQELVDKIGNRAEIEKDMASVVPFAGADGLAAVRYVREHAERFNVRPDRIGFMGFSAGGTVTTYVAFNYDEASRPDFIAPIYPATGVLADKPVPADAPPLFGVAATDDGLGLAADSVALYNKWLKAGKSAELHMYAQGGHGFGMRKQHLPSDSWIERFGDWLGAQHLLGESGGGGD